MQELSSKEQIKQLFKLAIPVSIGQAGNIIATMCDSAMLGKYDTEHMIASVFAFQIFVIPFILQIGLSIGMTAIIAKDDGEGKKSNILGSGLFTYLLFSFLIAVIIFGLSFCLHWFNSDRAMIALAAPYLQLMAFTMIPIGIFLSLKQYFEGYGLTNLMTICSVIANILNIVIGYALIFGHFGFEAHGIIGAGYAMLISRVLGVIIAVGCIYFFKNHRLKITNNDFKIYKRKCVELIKVGVPISLQMFIEVTAFCVAGIFIATISHEALGAHNVALQYAGLTFLMVTGFGSATTILAGNYYGEQNYKMLRQLIKNTLLIVIVYEIFTALLFLLFCNQMPYLFLKDNEIAMITASILLIKMAAVFQIPDGLQNCLQGILRGVQDVKVPMWIAVFVHYVITLFMGYLLAFTFKLGIVGFWYGFIFGLSILAVLLYVRMRKVLKKLDGNIFDN
jgi:multidrug resistance protein, MATE family